MSREEMLRDYFGRYARVSLGPTPEKLADLYDTSFLAAGDGSLKVAAYVSQEDQEDVMRAHGLV